MIGATLFSGIGAPEVAMPGWDWRWHAEIEKFPAAVMAVRHPGSVNLGDVTADDFCERAERIGRPDVLVFGSPCQDFSVAGRRLGLDGARGNLAICALRIVARLKPRWFTFENVPGLLSNWSGAADGPAAPGSEWESVENSDFAAFVGLVDELGYFGAWASLDAQWRGLAQRRDRLFFVGHSGDWRGPAAVLFEPASLCGDHPPRREAGERVAPTIEARANAGGAGWGTDFMVGGGLAAVGEVAGAVSAKWAKGTGGPAGDECYNLMAFSSKDYGADAQNDLSPTLRAGSHDESHANAGVPPAIAFAQNTRDEVRLVGGDGAIVGALSAEAGTKQQSYVSFQTRIARNGRGQPEEIVPALNGADAGTTSDMRPVVAGPGGVVRRLTPRECERLQGFPDDYTLIQFRGKPAADGPRYRSLGNSMAVPVIRHILQRIEMLDSLA